jgi:hypothetical protein
MGRFVVHTRTGRWAAVGYVGSAVLLGMLLGVVNASELVSLVVLVLFFAFAVPVLFWLAIREGRRQSSR